MRDAIGRCGVCGAPLPRLAGRGHRRRFCTPAHRQAAYRMRSAARRGRPPAPESAQLAAARRRAAAAAAALATAAWAVRASVLRPGLGPREYAAAAAGLAALAAEAEAATVAAGRAAGATWRQTGAALGLSADSARKRFGQ